MLHTAHVFWTHDTVPRGFTSQVLHKCLRSSQTCLPSLTLAGRCGVQICLSYPQVGDAKRYAMLAFRNYLTCRGADSPCTLRLHGYMMNPESHPASQTAQQYAEAVRRNIEVGIVSLLETLELGKTR